MSQLAQQKIQELLREEYARSKSRNGSFSLRALARKCGLHSAAVSEILNGKRIVSKKLANRIADTLALSPNKRLELVAAFDHEKGQKFIPHKKRLEVDADRYQLIADWYHFAILSLTETIDFKANIAWISRRLGIPLSVARRAVERLLRAGLLERIGESLRPTGRSFSSPDHISLPALKRAHQQNLELAEKALFNISIDQRDFCAITMAINPDILPKARARVRQFMADMESLLEVTPQTDVYKLCVQLFPISKVGE